MDKEKDISFWDVPIIIVDVETTGSDPKRNRITDIACVKIQNGEIVEEFKSLVNPHQMIPPFIVQMTGITYDMVVNAPEPKDVFLEVDSRFKIENTIFSAHNAGFDLGFVNNTLIREGYKKLSNPSLCTLKLARRLLPKKIKKNVGALADYFNIHVPNRHRALGDAVATANFLIELLHIVETEHGITSIKDLLIFQNKQIKHFQAPDATHKRVQSQLEELPIEPGVYYFKDNKGKILYVGKAKSLKERVKSYFTTDTFTSKKIARLFKYIHKIEWECVNTELEALLLESKEIKKHKPYYNTVDKIYKTYPFVKITLFEDFPRIETCETIEDDGAEYYGPLRSMALAEDIVEEVEKRFKIRKCDTKWKPKDSNKPCFYYHIQQCDSPCSMKINRVEYLKEIDNVKLYLSGLPEGILTQIKNKMEYHAARLEFEEAEKAKRNLFELQKLFNNNELMQSSVHGNNKIVLFPNSSHEKTVDVFLIKSGLLNYQTTMGRKAPLNNLKDIIHDTYFNGNSNQSNFDKVKINEIKIVNSWLNRYDKKTTILYLEDKKEKELFDELESSLRNISFPENNQNE